MTKIILHCSDSRWGNAAIIDSWHQERGFQGRTGHHIGYHFVVLNGKVGPRMFNKNFDGHIETGRPIDDDNHIESWEMGAHTKGQNTGSIGVCLIGKSGEFTPLQLNAVVHLLRDLKEQFYDEIEVWQHSDFDDKKPFCAGLTTEEMLKIKHSAGIFED